MDILLIIINLYKFAKFLSKTCECKVIRKNAHTICIHMYGMFGSEDEVCLAFSALSKFGRKYLQGLAKTKPWLQASAVLLGLLCTSAPVL